MTVPYTDAEGVVHIRALGTGETLCGKDAAVCSEARAKVVCDPCVADSITQYADETAKKACGPQRPE